MNPQIPPLHRLHSMRKRTASKRKQFNIHQFHLNQSEGISALFALPNLCNRRNLRIDSVFCHPTPEPDTRS